MTQDNEDKLFTPDKKQVYTAQKTENKGQAGRPPKKEGQKKSKKLVLTLKPADYENLKQHSDITEMSINEFIRMCILYYIQLSNVRNGRL